MSSRLVATALTCYGCAYLWDTTWGRGDSNKRELAKHLVVLGKLAFTLKHLDLDLRGKTTVVEYSHETI
jgi:hypothetical protein